MSGNNSDDNDVNTTAVFFLGADMIESYLEGAATRFTVHYVVSTSLPVTDSKS